MDISCREAFEVIRCGKCFYYIDEPYGLECGHFYCTTCIKNDTRNYELDGRELETINCEKCKKHVDVKECKELTQEVQKYMDIIQNK